MYLYSLIHININTLQNSMKELRTVYSIKYKLPLNLYIRTSEKEPTMVANTSKVTAVLS